MEYKLVSFDLDYTLLNSEHTLSDSQIEPLNDIASRSVLVFASGRPLESMIPTADKLAKGAVKYFIANNGSLVTDHDGNVMYQSVLSSDVVKALLERALEYGVHAHFYDGGQIVGLYRSPFIERDSRVINLPILIEESIDAAILNRSINKIIVMGDPPKMKEYFDSLKDFDSINPILAKPYFIEIPAKGVDKGVALKNLLDLLGLKPEEVIACGDSFNDVGMLELAGLGLAMKNASDGVKNYAERVLTITNDENLAEVVLGILKEETREEMLSRFTVLQDELTKA
ncbi:Cof-type HAD-IIB family hydrolase [Guggenheimella bovis]